MKTIGETVMTWIEFVHLVKNMRECQKGRGTKEGTMNLENKVDGIIKIILEGPKYDSQERG